MYEVHECIEYLDTWIWMDDKCKELSRMVIDVETEVFQDKNPFGDWEPNECSVEECCGNAGATMERWYSQAALVLWPHSIVSYSPLAVPPGRSPAIPPGGCLAIPPGAHPPSSSSPPPSPYITIINIYGHLIITFLMYTLQL